jgi:kynurenine formamidase
MCAPQVIQAIGDWLGRREFLGMVLSGAAAVGAPAMASPAEAAEAKRPPSRGAPRNVMGLSHVLSAQFPIWPGFAPIQVTKVRDHDKDGFYVNSWTLVEHHGTHVDAPIHFAKGKWSADEIPDATLVAPAVVIHVHDRAKADPDTAVTVDDLKAWERRHGRIPAAAAVFMHSGWEARANDQAAFRNADAQDAMHFPGFGKDAAEFLVKERSIVGIGVDTLSLDLGNSKDFAVHVTVLGANKWGIENLANLARIPESGATVFVGVPKVKAASGGPARVVAVW